MQCCTNTVRNEDARGMEARICTMHYVVALTCLSTSALFSPHELSHTCIQSTGINFPLPISTCPEFLHTGMSVKVAKKKQNPKLILTPDIFFLFHSFITHALGQREALTPWLLPALHCQLVFFIFHAEGGWGDRMKGRVHVEWQHPSPAVCFHSRLPFSSPLSSCWPSLPLALFHSIHHFFFLPWAFPSSFLVIFPPYFFSEDRHASSHTQRWHQTGIWWKDYLLNR